MKSKVVDFIAGKMKSQVNKVNNIHSQIESKIRDSLLLAKEAGAILNELKEEVKEEGGSWLEFIEHEFKTIGERQCQKYMSISKYWNVLAKNQHTIRLSIDKACEYISSNKPQPKPKTANTSAKQQKTSQNNNLHANTHRKAVSGKNASKNNNLGQSAQANPNTGTVYTTTGKSESRAKKVKRANFIVEQINNGEIPMDELLLRFSDRQFDLQKDREEMEAILNGLSPKTETPKEQMSVAEKLMLQGEIYHFDKHFSAVLALFDSAVAAEKTKLAKAIYHVVKLFGTKWMMPVNSAVKKIAKTVKEKEIEKRENNLRSWEERLRQKEINIRYQQAMTRGLITKEERKTLMSFVHPDKHPEKQKQANTVAQIISKLLKE